MSMDKVKAPPKRIMAIGSNAKGICPTCKRICRMSDVTDGTGWRTLTCEYGHINEYRIQGAPN